MTRLSLPTLFSVVALVFASGCAQLDGDDETGDPTMSEQALAVRVCPEAVTRDSRGEPRNASGFVRYCWPGDASCFCDSDNDCYATSGYVACTPPGSTTDAGVRDTGVRDTGARDTGTVDTGVRDTGVRDTGPVDTGVRDTGPVDTGVRDSGAPVDTGTPPASGTAPVVGGCQIFPANNPWNQDVSALPLHPNSAAIIANIQAHGPTTVKADFGSSAEYGIPFVVVPQTQTFVPIRFNLYPDESDPGPYPIPSNAPVEGGADDHVIALQQGSCMLFEMYRASRSSTGWNAGAGAMFDLRSNELRPRGWTSCDQAGLPIFAGLARYDEVTAGEIRHALRVTFNHTRNGWIAPATHPGGDNDVNAPPMGLRMRLRANYDISRFTGQTRVILNALRRYGMFVADTGTNWYISGATDSRWNDTDLRQLMNVPGTAFEVVNTGSMQQW